MPLPWFLFLGKITPTITLWGEALAAAMPCNMPWRKNIKTITINWGCTEVKEKRKNCSGLQSWCPFGGCQCPCPGFFRGETPIINLWGVASVPQKIALGYKKKTCPGLQSWCLVFSRCQCPCPGFFLGKALTINLWGIALVPQKLVLDSKKLKVVLGSKVDAWFFFWKSMPLPQFL